MKKNVGSIDKVIRVIIALVLAYFAYKGGYDSEWIPYVFYAVSIIMLLTTLLGSCPIYSVFGVKTTKKKDS